MTYEITPMMELWLADAEAMELANTMQHGMLFCLGYTLCMNTRRTEGFIMENAIAQLSTAAMAGRKISERYDQEPIRGVLTELVMKADPDYAERVLESNIETDSVNYHPDHATNCLPAIDPASRAVGDWDPLMIKLYFHIGKELDLDPEACYLAGIEMAMRDALADFDTTFLVAIALDRFRAPYVCWLFNLPYLGEEWIEPASQDTLMHKILHAKLMDWEGQLPATQQLAKYVFGFMEKYTVTIQPLEERIHAIELETHLFLGALVQVPVSSDFFDQLDASERELLLDHGFEAPPLGMNPDEVVQWVIEGVSERHGYQVDNILQKEAWQCSFRACAITYYAMACLLQPGWNASCLTLGQLPEAEDTNDSE